MKHTAFSTALVVVLLSSAPYTWGQQTGEERLYTNPVHKWSVSYPADWILNSQDLRFIKIQQPAKLPFGLVGIQSSLLPAEFRSLDAFVDLVLRGESVRPGFQVLSRTRTILPDGTPAVEVINVLGVGTVGKSRKICAVVEGRGLCVNAETYLDSWSAMETYFDRMLRSFTPVSAQVALSVLRTLADQGDATAQFRLGAMYYEGLEVPRDYSEAAKWYRKAADQGDAAAQTLLGDCYYRGEGVTQDYVEAVAWYRKAAQQADAFAQLRMGVAYEAGRGAPQDFVEAHMWVSLAIAGLTGGTRQQAVTLALDLASKLTSEQLAEAQRRAKEWKPAGTK
jgi:hypothetical protein